MSNSKRIALVLYSVVILITFGSGLRFLFANEFFPYHAQAASVDWVNVNPGVQFLALAGFKVIGAGFLAVALSMGLILIYPFFKYNQRWSFYAIPAVGLAFWSILLTITVKVSAETQASAPWGGSLFCVLMLLFAFLVSLFDQPLIKRSHNEEDLT